MDTAKAANLYVHAFPLLNLKLTRPIGSLCTRMRTYSTL